jgi:hypothetical protein
MEHPTFAPGIHRQRVDRLRTVLARRERFELAHPEVPILTPQLSGSGMWEARPPGRELLMFSSGEQMVAVLEEMYPEVTR